MKKQLLAAGIVSVLLFVLSSCLKDSMQSSTTYRMYTPVYNTIADVRASMKSSAPVAVHEPGKLYIRGNYIFLAEANKGIHIIDNSNPVQPKNVSFIAIPGNMDLAVKNNTLYADMYGDLMVIDISDPLAAHLTKQVPNVFSVPYVAGYLAADSNLVIVDWIIKDTTVTQNVKDLGWNERETNNGGVIYYFDDYSGFALNALSSKATAPVPGISGSMARFTITADRLYTVGNQNLSVFNIVQEADPQFVTATQLNWGIETIYPFKDKLFIGSNSGMFMFDISNPDQPQQTSIFSHVRTCDPVIADDDNAYVTLRSGTTCAGFTNQLDVLNIQSITQPTLVKSYPLTHPTGLSKDGNLLFVCDDVDGLKVFDASNPGNLKLLQTVPGFAPYDVIAYNKIALVVAADGLYQFNYSDPTHWKQLSKLTRE